MQYRIAPLGAARGQLVTCVAAVLVIWGLTGCGEASFPTPMERPAADEPSTELSYFGFEPADNPQLEAAAVGEISGQDVHVDLPFGTRPDALVPRIEHRGAMVAPGSGVAQDFTAPVLYVVTAQDGSEASYTVTVDVLAESMQPEPTPDAGAVLEASKEITAFSIAGVAATIGSDTIELTVPHDTRLLNITPELTYKGASISPGPLVPRDFRRPVTYVVKAQDGSTRSYTVHVTVAPNYSKDITHFRVFGIESTISGTEIRLIVPEGTDLTMLAPTITLSGGTVSPPSEETQDFSQPVAYTVTSADGTSQTYNVVVLLATGSANDITSFEVAQVVTTLRGDDIQLFVPFGTSDCQWAPTIAHAGARIEPASGELQDFKAGVVYTVTAADGTQRRYTATCQIAESSARGIERFEVLGLPATIIGDDITLTVPNGASLGALSPTIVHHGVRLSPPSGLAQNFFNPVVYTVTEANGDKHKYTVRVVSADPSDNELIGLVYEGRRAQIAGQKVTLTLPWGSDVSAVLPTFLQRGARVTPTGIARDFTTPQVYGVIARDNTRRDYEVSVRSAGKGEAVLSDFVLSGVAGEIAGTDISVQFPAGSDLRALAPSFVQHTGVGIEPQPDALQDFSEPVSYVVSAADGTTQTYVVHASVAGASTSELVGFRVLGIDAPVSTNQLELSLPAGTNLQALVPTLSVAGSSVDPLSSLPQDFSEPVTYTVTAADGSSKRFRVAITLLQ